MPLVERNASNEEAFAALERIMKPGWSGRFAGIIAKGKVVRMVAIADPKRFEPLGTKPGTR